MFELFSKYILYFALCFTSIVTIVSMVLVYRSKQSFKFIKYCNLTMVLIALGLVVFEMQTEKVPVYTALLIVIMGSLLPGYSLYERTITAGETKSDKD